MLTIYRHFESKQALLEEVAKSSISETPEDFGLIAMVMARFVAIILLPSSGELLVMANVLAFFPGSLYWMFVLRARKLSEIIDFGRKWVMIPKACLKE